MTRTPYDQFAEEFAATRQHPWPEVESFLDGRSAGVALDVGCGNGRHAVLLADAAERVVGVDLSRALLAVAREWTSEQVDDDAPTLVLANAGTLPLASRTVDLAVYVAALHHLRPRRARRRSLDELARVLAPDGVALVSAWCVEHDRFDRETAFDTTVDWTLPGGETVPRFYHVYDREEFRADVAASALSLVDFEVSSGNCYGVVCV